MVGYGEDEGSKPPKGKNTLCPLPDFVQDHTSPHDRMIVLSHINILHILDKAKVKFGIHFVMRAMISFYCNELCSFQGKWNKQSSSWCRSSMLHIFLIPFTVGEFLAFSLESKVSNVMETEEWAWLRGLYLKSHLIESKLCFQLQCICLPFSFLDRRMEN